MFLQDMLVLLATMQFMSVELMNMVPPQKQKLWLRERHAKKFATIISLYTKRFMIGSIATLIVLEEQALPSKQWLHRIYLKIFTNVVRHLKRLLINSFASSANDSLLTDLCVVSVQCVTSLMPKVINAMDVVNSLMLLNLLDHNALPAAQHPKFVSQNIYSLICLKFNQN